MLTLHHLNDSRSQRILWLLEELGHALRDEALPAQRRDPAGAAGTEGSASARQVARHHRRRHHDRRIRRDRRLHHPPLRQGRDDAGAGSADYEAYNEWLHYSEGSAMLPLMLNLYVSRLKEAGAPLHPRIDSELANHLGYVDGALKGRDFFVGNVADRRRHPDELCRRDGKSVRQARAVSEPGGLAGADARPAGIPALGREGRGVPVCDVTLNVIPGRCEASNPADRRAAICAQRNRCRSGTPPPELDRLGKAGATVVTESWRPLDPTISCINISHTASAWPLPAMWYLAAPLSIATRDRPHLR